MDIFKFITERANNNKRVITKRDPMEDFFLARQAIYDRELGVFAYELLFRDGHKQTANFTDGTSATSQIIINAFLDRGLDKIVADKLAFINLTHDLLLHEDTRQLPKDKVVLEILEDVSATPEVITAVQELANNGFCIALDDFFYNESLKPLVELANIIKIDILPMSEHEIEEHVQRLKKEGCQLLAEKIETREQFEFCKAIGFDYFQGYFIERPHIIQGRRLPANRLMVLQLLGKLQNPDVEFEDLQEVISKDVSLSYRVLRTINSSMYQLPKEVESIRTAINFLGMKQLKHLASMMALANFDDKPGELMKLALIRAKFTELLSQQLKRANPEVCFTAGLFSVLDALFDLSMTEIVKELPLSDELLDALLTHGGEVGAILEMAIHYEKGNWEYVNLPDGCDLDITEIYLSSIEWADQSINQLQT